MLLCVKEKDYVICMCGGIPSFDSFAPSFGHVCDVCEHHVIAVRLAEKSNIHDVSGLLTINNYVAIAPNGMVQE